MDDDRRGSLATSASSPPISTVSPSKDPEYHMDSVPGSPAEWKKYAMDHKLAGGSIFDLDKYASASKISEKQFLCLRVLWTKNQAKFLANDDNRRTWLGDVHYLEARHLLLSLPSWQAYLDIVGESGERVLQRAFPDIGTFSLVRYHQERVRRYPENENFISKFSPVAHRTRSRFTSLLRKAIDTPTPKSRIHTEEIDPFVTPLKQSLEAFSFSSDDSSPVPHQSTRTDVPDSASPVGKDIIAQHPPADDEQIVNVALVLLLNAVTMHFVPNADWTFHRKAFQIGDKKSGKGFEAKVDGFLRRLSDDKVMAILEVKPCVRGRQPVRIRMQESAQMAAWISHCPDDCTTPDSNGNFT
jgi:hypothetical protein